MIRTIALVCSLLLVSCSIFRPVVPQPKQDFRAVWVATVANIDWPSSGRDSWNDQQESYRKLLDFYQHLNFNTVIVQVRMAGDALYPSVLAPWSRYLTGEEGIPPKSNTDPLKWLISETHRRGMDFHAWLNPYRATMSLDTLSLSEKHDFYRHRDWLVPYGNRYYYDPGLPGVQDHLLEILKEVVTGYEVDGIHFDDYFYPYRIEGEVFRDSATYSNYALNNQTIPDWRRSNVDSLISRVHGLLKREKPWVQFGVSPFGVWRNQDKDSRGSDSRAGQTTYDDLYADPLKWIDEGWLDYIVPQIYWSMDFPPASHRKLLGWWATNAKGTRLYIGNGAYKIRNNNDASWNSKKELPRQLLLARKTPEVQGNVLFSARSLLTQPDVVKLLRKSYFKYPALPPPTNAVLHNTRQPPDLTSLQEEKQFFRLSFNYPEDGIWKYALFYAARNTKQLNLQDPAQLVEKSYTDGRTVLTLGKQLTKGKKALAVSFVDCFGQESRPIIVHLEKTNQDDPEK